MKRVLVAPLDWGLGHASRCIPIIKEFQKQSCEVFLAGSGNSLSLLKQEFPILKAFSLPGYDPEYPVSGSMVWKMASQLPHFIRVIRKEHALIEELVSGHNIDIVVSDNRYGCWSAKAHSVFITHQSNIMMPKRFGWLSPWVRRRNLTMIKKFDACWIPDDPNHKLAGDLTHFGDYTGIVPTFIGHLSKFTLPAKRPVYYDVVVILSGPEPQRSVFEDIISSQLKISNLRYFLVRGLPNGTRSDRHSCDFMKADELQNLIESAAVVVARSGYSTVMDMVRLGKKVIFVPTPGQTEQEYLAARLKDLKISFAMVQNEFNLNFALKESQHYGGFTAVKQSDERLSNAVHHLLKQ